MTILAVNKIQFWRVDLQLKHNSLNIFLYLIYMVKLICKYVHSTERYIVNIAQIKTTRIPQKS